MIQANDYKNLTKGRVSTMLENLYQFELSDSFEETDNNAPSPQKINEWLLENEILRIFSTVKIINMFRLKITQCQPCTYYGDILRYKKILMFIGETLNKQIYEINDNDIKEEHFEMVASSGVHITTLKYMYKHYFPNSNRHWSTQEKLPLLKHPIIDDQIASLYGLKIKSKQTRMRAYYHFLSWLCKVQLEFSMNNPNDIPLYLVRQEHLLEFGLFLKQKVLRNEFEESYANSIQHYVYSLFRFFYQEGRLLHDITNSLTTINYGKYIYRDIPTDQEISTLLNIIRNYAPEPNKVKLAFEFMLILGLRKIEVALIRWEDIDFNRQIIIINSKGGSRDPLPIPQRLLNTIKSVRNETFGLVFSDNPRQFAEQLYVYYKIFALIAGWMYPGGLHLFRHTFITKLTKQKDIPLQLVKTLARHKKSETTSGYIHRDPATLENEINRLNMFS